MRKRATPNIGERITYVAPEPRGLDDTDLALVVEALDRFRDAIKEERPYDSARALQLRIRLNKQKRRIGY